MTLHLRHTYGNFWTFKLMEVLWGQRVICIDATLLALIPRMDQNQIYPVMQSAGVRTILTYTLVLAVGKRWALLHNST